MLSLVTSRSHESNNDTVSRQNLLSEQYCKIYDLKIYLFHKFVHEDIFLLGLYGKSLLSELLYRLVPQEAVHFVSPNSNVSLGSASGHIEGAFHSNQSFFGNFQWRMEQHFPKIPKKRTTSRGLPKFSKMFSRKFSFHLTYSPSFYNFRLNGSHFGNSTVSGISGKLLYYLPRFPSF